MLAKVILVLLCFGQLLCATRLTSTKSRSEGIKVGDGVPHKVTGVNFRNMHQYPTLEEASAMDLRDVVNLRRGRVHGPEKQYYEHLFASHPCVVEIASLDPASEEYIQSWIDLWARYGSDDPKCKKLCYSIMDYLSNDRSVPAEVREEIYHRRQKIVNAACQRRKREKTRLSEDPKDIQKRKEELARFANYRQEKKGYNDQELREISAARFRDLLISERIALDLPAQQLEEATRHLRDVLGGTQLTTTSLRNYLLCRKNSYMHKQSIDRAVHARRILNNRITKQISNEKRRAREKEARRSRISNAKAESREQADERGQKTASRRDAQSLSRLLAVSDWWMP